MIFGHFSQITTKIRKRLHQIPQACPADRSAFHYTQNAALSVAENRLCSEKPKLPQGKPAGFIVQRGLRGGDRREVSFIQIYFPTRQLFFQVLLLITGKTGR